MLSDPQLRAAYDKYGKDSAKPDSGFGKNVAPYDMAVADELYRGPIRVLYHGVWRRSIRGLVSIWLSSSKCAGQD